MKIAHISDLHFGAHDPAVLEALVAHLTEAGPHLVIASGDITQSATEAEFAAARAFSTPCRWRSSLFPATMTCRGWT